MGGGWQGRIAATALTGLGSLSLCTYDISHRDRAGGGKRRKLDGDETATGGDETAAAPETEKEEEKEAEPTVPEEPDTSHRYGRYTVSVHPGIRVSGLDCSYISSLLTIRRAGHSTGSLL